MFRLNLMNVWGFCCLHCRQPLAIASHGICCRCYRLLSLVAYCGHCGSPLPTYHRTCGQCLRSPPKWDQIIQVSRYQSPLSDWIQQFKFQHKFWFDQMLARLLLLAIRNTQRQQHWLCPDVIMPVPLFWQRDWHRGYNQSELIARYLAKWLNLPLDTESLLRIKATPPQRQLTATERRKNLKGAFVYQPIKPYKCIALVDDVITTGSTMNTICSELLKQGVEHIQVWTLARA